MDSSEARQHLRDLNQQWGAAWPWQLGWAVLFAGLSFMNLLMGADALRDTSDLLLFMHCLNLLMAAWCANKSMRLARDLWVMYRNVRFTRHMLRQVMKGPTS